MVKLVYEDWMSGGKKARIVDSFETDHGYILLELLKHKDGYFIGISRNTAYPDMESWLSCYTVTSDDAYDIFNYIKDNVTDGTWWELTKLMKNSGCEYKLQSLLNCTDRQMNPNYVMRKTESLTVNERHDPVHFLSNNPTDYERYVNYAETLVLVCENLTEAAERCLRRIEDNEEFYTDPKNERWYGFDEKTEQIAKVMRQVESLTNKIDKKM
jgi:hypothetical protein